MNSTSASARADDSDRRLRKLSLPDTFRIVLDGRTISDHFPGIGRYAYQLAGALAVELAGTPGAGELILVHQAAPSASRFDLAALAALPGLTLVPSQARPFSIAEQVRLPAELRRLQAAVLHFPYYVLPYRAPRPRVVTIHDAIPLRFPAYFSPVKRWLYRLATALALRGAARVICVSAATRDDLCRAFGLPRERAAVVYEGVDERFRPQPPEAAAAVRARYRLPERFLLYLGSHKPHKNLARLVDAYGRLADPPPLVLAGREDPRYPAARERVAALGLAERVRFPGAIAEADLPALYSSAQAFAFVSEYEGFGLPPLEAMACGTPVVCSDAPGLAETAAPAALTADPGDLAALAAALARVLDDDALRAELRARGLAQAAAFSWSRAARATLAVYAEARQAAAGAQKPAGAR